MRLALLFMLIGRISGVVRKSSLHSKTVTARNMYSRSGDSTVKHVLVPVANGSEEIESVTIIDCLVRAGASVCVASVESTHQVTCSRGVKLVADVLIDECKTYEWDLIAIPGGMPGATSLRECVVLCEMLVKQNTQGKSLGAVCAAPAVVLAPLSILDGKKATCYPAAKFRTSLPTETDDRVTVDGNIITSQGPGTTMEFALKLIETLYGKEKMTAIGKELLFK